MSYYETKGGLGREIFGDAKLGDRRRTKRLITIFDQMQRHPGGTLPEKVMAPADLKALYRFCATKSVTHGAIIESLRRYTLRRIARHDGAVLIVHDATELDYSSLESLALQLGQIGKGTHRGYVCHNVIAVDPDTGEVLGLLDQILHCRVRVPKKETMEQHRNRASRESLLWLKGTGSLPDDQRLIDVADQGASTFEFLEHETRSGRRFVIRNGSVRKVSVDADPASPEKYLKEYVQNLDALGYFTMDVQAQKGRRARADAAFAVRGGPIRLLPPHAQNGLHSRDPLPIYVVYVSEVSDPPAGEKPIDWMLLTNEPVTTCDDALRVVGWYETRWVIEEYHKAMKTGCRIEDMQFTAVERLQPAIALLSAVALTLLNLRNVSRGEDASTRPASTLFSSDYVETLSVWRYGTIRRSMTVKDFFFALARLGGHQNRKHDKPPGWLILWRGWTKLQYLTDGYLSAKDVGKPKDLS